MNFKKAIEILSTALTKHNPPSFTGTWVYQNAPRAYRFIRLNLRTPTGNIDWDAVTEVLDRSFQAKWDGRKRRPKKTYENQVEVDLILTKYQDKIYTLITVMDENDRRTRDRIIRTFVRTAQKGNILARREAVQLIRFIVEEWIEKYYVLQRWSGFGEILEEQIDACIRRYRFTGSFLGYLFKTLEYAGRGLAPLYSLDTPLSPKSGRTWMENVTEDPETGELRMLGEKSHYYG